ncbi:MAG: hypothetical protein M1486_02730 [Gammaproteobacteria bacterium]|nr:hypothetical protein [Gammaproteobacteria bacterium]
MDFLSALKIKDAFFKLHAYILNIFGKKIVNYDNYKDVVENVNPDYAETSPKCNKEKMEGGRFYWSNKMQPGYEKYFEIEGNTRRYFTCRGQDLWINRSHSKQ